MHYELCTDPLKTPSDCLVVGIWKDAPLPALSALINKQNNSLLDTLVSQKHLSGEVAESQLFYHLQGTEALSVLVVGCGDPKKYTASQYLKVMKHCVCALNQAHLQKAVFCLPELPVSERTVHWQLLQGVLTAERTCYRFHQMKTKETKPASLAEIAFYTPKKEATYEDALKQGEAIAQGMHVCCDLGNLPANICTATYLEQAAREAIRPYPKITIHVLNEPDLKKMGMGAFLAVNQGSVQPPKLIVLEYKGSAEETPPIAFIGKGITFDSGGISIKPSHQMEEMKFDMCGAASVLGTLIAAARLNLPLHLMGFMGCAENLPSGSAVKPGDIVKTMSGQTVEVLNTDAEGRLVLCDVLTYAETFKPKYMIDVATLTGAIIAALGHQVSGLMGTDEALVQALSEAAQMSHDKAWPLPLWEDFDTVLESSYADLANISNERAAGGIAAGVFLAKFTEGFKWAHLDVAGTAWDAAKNKGATGRPIPLLMYFLLEEAGIPHS